MINSRGVTRGDILSELVTTLRRGVHGGRVVVARLAFDWAEYDWREPVGVEVRAAETSWSDPWWVSVIQITYGFRITPDPTSHDDGLVDRLDAQIIECVEALALRKAERGGPLIASVQHEGMVEWVDRSLALQGARHQLTLTW